MSRAAHSLALSLLALLCASMGCRSGLPEGVRTEAPPSSSKLEVLPAGAVLAVRRPTPGVALLSLWFDAGSRDAEVPQLATVSAWWAAQRVGAEARVVPDGTELRLLCDTRNKGGAQECAKRLLKALQPEVPSSAALTALRERLRAARAHAAGDDVRLAQSLALQALLGGGAEALFPFGRAEHDARVDAEAVRLFSNKHFAPSRILLVGVGDVTSSDLERATASVRQTAAMPRAQRAPLKVTEELRIELGNSNQIALVVPVASTEQGSALLGAFRRAHPHAAGSVSSLRGAALLHVSLAGGSSPFARLQTAVFDLRRLRLEGVAANALPSPDGLAEMAQQLGETWVARGAAIGSNALAVGLVLRREDRAPVDEQTHLSKARERAVQAIANAGANSTGAFTGKTDDLQALVKSSAGARIRVERRRGDPWFAAAIRFSGGSAFDPPLSHGRAALLASLMADGCGFSSEGALDVRLSRLDAQLRPLVDADGTGLSIRAPMANAEEALDTLLRCAVRPAFTSRAVEDARARLVQALWGRSDALLQASLARALSPAAPGRVAPWGTPGGVANVDAAELRRLHARGGVAQAVSVWVVADRAPADLARFVARRLAHLPSGSAQLTEALPSPSAEVEGALVSDGALRVVLGVAAKGRAADSVAPRVFADALSRALGKVAGQAIWAWGAGTQDQAMAGVALTLSEAQLDALKSLTSQALREVAALPEGSLSTAILQAQAARNGQLSSSRAWVETAFHGRDDSQRGELRDELALIRRLAGEKPSFFVLRPRP